MSSMSWFRSTISAMSRIVTCNDNEGVQLHQLLLDLESRFQLLPEKPPQGIVDELTKSFFDALDVHARLMKAFVESQPPAIHVDGLRSQIRGMAWALRQMRHEELLPVLTAWEARVNAIPGNPSYAAVEKVHVAFCLEISECELLHKADIAQRALDMVQVFREGARSYANLAATRELTAEEMQQRREEEDRLRRAEQRLEEAMGKKGEEDKGAILAPEQANLSG